MRKCSHLKIPVPRAHGWITDDPCNWRKVLRMLRLELLSFLLSLNGYFTLDPNSSSIVTFMKCTRISSFGSWQGALVIFGEGNQVYTNLSVFLFDYSVIILLHQIDWNHFQIAAAFPFFSTYHSQAVCNQTERAKISESIFGFVGLRLLNFVYSRQEIFRQLFGYFENSEWHGHWSLRRWKPRW